MRRNAKFGTRRFSRKQIRKRVLLKEHSLQNSKGKYLGLQLRHQSVLEYHQPKQVLSPYPTEIPLTRRTHPSTGTPIAYKLVSREVPRLMPQEGGLVWKRGGFARHAIHVTPYAEDQLYPAGKYVPQTSGEPSMGLPQWIEDTSSANIENTDVVLWHTFGLTHFPRAEDFPLMPTESVSLIFRPNNFFTKNPGLDIRPSACSFPGHEVDGRDKGSVYAKPAENVSKGCGCEANL